MISRLEQHMRAKLTNRSIKSMKILVFENSRGAEGRKSQHGNNSIIFCNVIKLFSILKFLHIFVKFRLCLSMSRRGNTENPKSLIFYFSVSFPNQIFSLNWMLFCCLSFEGWCWMSLILSENFFLEGTKTRFLMKRNSRGSWRCSTLEVVKNRPNLFRFNF